MMETSFVNGYICISQKTAWDRQFVFVDSELLAIGPHGVQNGQLNNFLVYKKHGLLKNQWLMKLEQLRSLFFLRLSSDSILNFGVK